MSRANIMQAVLDDMIQSPFGGEPIAPEDCHTRIHVSTRTKVLAMEEWAAMRPDGSLPDWWPAKRAEIEARIAALTPAQQEVGS